MAGSRLLPFPQQLTRCVRGREALDVALEPWPHVVVLARLRAGASHRQEPLVGSAGAGRGDQPMEVLLGRSAVGLALEDGAEVGQRPDVPGSRAIAPRERFRA